MVYRFRKSFGVPTAEVRQECGVMQLAREYLSGASSVILNKKIVLKRSDDYVITALDLCGHDVFSLLCVSVN